MVPVAERHVLNDLVHPDAHGDLGDWPSNSARILRASASHSSLRNGYWLTQLPPSGLDLANLRRAYRCER